MTPTSSIFTTGLQTYGCHGNGVYCLVPKIKVLFQIVLISTAWEMGVWVREWVREGMSQGGSQGGSESGRECVREGARVSGSVKSSLGMRLKRAMHRHCSVCTILGLTPFNVPFLQLHDEMKTKPGNKVVFQFLIYHPYLFKQNSLFGHYFTCIRKCLPHRFVLQALILVESKS